MTAKVVTLGEAMIRLWVPPGERLESATRFNVAVAGAEANVAVALARTGTPSAWLSKLPDNPLGRRTSRTLAGQGVDVSGVSWADSGRMGTFYVELNRPPRPVNVVYDRAGSAASTMTTSDIAWNLVEDAQVAFVSGITAALSDTCLDLTSEFMARARAAGTTVVFDVNYRSKLWPQDRAAAVLGELARSADVVIVSRDDLRDVFSLEGPTPDLLEGMSEIAGTRSIAMTMGAEGAAWLDGTQFGTIDPIEAKVVDPIGAGDAFAAGVITGVLKGDLRSGAELGAALGAIQVGLYGDLLIVEPGEIEAVRRGPGRDVAR